MVRPDSIVNELGIARRLIAFRTVSTLNLVNSTFKMTHNKAITATSALPILVDCQPGEKEDGFATWSGLEPQPKPVRRFAEPDAQVQRKERKRDRFEKLGRLIGAMAGKDKVEVEKWKKQLSATIDTEMATKRKYDLDRDYKHYLGYLELRASYGAKPDQESWDYGRRYRREKLLGAYPQRFGIARDLGLEVPLYSPPPVGRKGSKEREERKKYDKQFKMQIREMERKLDEILTGERLAPSLENEINLSHWQLSKLLSEVKFVIWHHKKSFQPALYCGRDLNAAYWAFLFAKNLFSLSSRQALCEFCGRPFVITRTGKTHCSTKCQAAHAVRRMRARHRKQERTRH